jgi:hypothetical protein
MYHLCPATGHIGATDDASPPFCPVHGAELFSTCRACGSPWDLLADAPDGARARGGRFYRYCGEPAPWLERDDLMAWVRHRVQSSADLSVSARAELVALLDRLKDLDPSDDKAVPVWKRLHDLAPKVYNATKPVRDALMSEGVKRVLEGLFGSG